MPFAYAASRLTVSQHALPLKIGVERSNSWPGLQTGAVRRSRSLARTGSQSGTNCSKSGGRRSVQSGRPPPRTLRR